MIKMRILGFDIDALKEITETLGRNKSRTFLTAFGIFWGVFMLLILMGGGKGVKELMSKQFTGFATNSLAIFATPTTKPYAGFARGRIWTLTEKDVSNIKQKIKSIDKVTPLCFGGETYGIVDGKKTKVFLQGLRSDYAQIQIPVMYYGRYINESDEYNCKKVCVLRKKVYKELFKEGENPCGKKIKINNAYYDIIGVDFIDTQIRISDHDDISVSIPLSLYHEIYGGGDKVDLIMLTGKKGTCMSDNMSLLRNVVAEYHKVDPKDEKSIMMFNSEVMFDYMNNFFNGVNLFILLIGIGTLIAGCIGVSNIMLVTVKERTTEIGIRRAVGARPIDILRQILAESVLLTLVAGIGGILLSVIILHMIELGNTSDGILNAHFQVSFIQALLALTFLSILGTLSGIPPALRAIKIKAVEAMRDKG